MITLYEPLGLSEGHNLIEIGAGSGYTILIAREIVGAEVQVHAGATVEIELDPAFEHAVQVLDCRCLLEGQPLPERALHVLGAGRGSVALSSSTGGRLLLIGGPPFPEAILMWWNFVARTPDEIAEARADWEAQRRFGEVQGYPRPRLAAPELAPCVDELGPGRGQLGCCLVETVAGRAGIDAYQHRTGLHRITGIRAEFEDFTGGLGLEFHGAYGLDRPGSLDDQHERAALDRGRLVLARGRLRSA